MNKSRVYTRTGDSGTTSLVGGVRVPKTSPRIEAYGTIDELSAHVGLLRTMSCNIEEQYLRQIQETLFVVGGTLACEADTPLNLAEQLAEMEQHIDALDNVLPPLHNFVISGDTTREAAQAHVCRTVCRRAERAYYACGVEQTDIARYLNRLSDYLFVLARTL